MPADYLPWDDGAAKPITVNEISGQQIKLADGPGVLLGYSLYNDGAASVSVTLLDGAAQNLVLTSITNGNRQQGSLPDRGIKFRTELDILVGAGGSVHGVVYVRQKYDYPGEE